MAGSFVAVLYPVAIGAVAVIAKLSEGSSIPSLRAQDIIGGKAFLCSPGFFCALLGSACVAATGTGVRKRWPYEICACAAVLSFVFLSFLWIEWQMSGPPLIALISVTNALLSGFCACGITEKCLLKRSTIHEKG
jgi:hypothetical protein